MATASIVARIVARPGGDLELADAAGQPVALRPTVTRLLAALLADHGAELDAGELVRRTWGDDPPADPTASLHTTVARLRRSLPEGAVTRTGAGYRLDLPAGVLTGPPAGGDAGASPVGFGPGFVPVLPLVGRASIVDAAVAAAGAGRGVVLHGETGAGKTRLAEEVVLRLHDAGWPAVMLRCRATGTAVPLGAFAPVLDGALPAAGLPMVVAARESIVERLGGRRLALGIDDLHQIDTLSAVLASQLVHGGHAVVVGTHRSSEYVPPAVADLWHEGLCDHTHVPPLDPGEVRALAEACTGRSVPADESERLWTLTHGNPLFLTIVTRDDGAGTPGTRSTLEELIAGQLAGLSPELRDALTVVAIAEPVSAAVLEELTDVTALIELERAGLVAIDRDGARANVRLRHPLHGEHLRATMSRLLARGIRAQLADALARRGARRHDDLMRLAAWSLEANRPLEVDVGVRAARDALRHNATDLARRVAAQTWEVHGHVDAAVVLAEVAYLDEPGGAAAAIAGEAVPGADPSARRRLVGLAARDVALKLGDTDRADALLAAEAVDPWLLSVRAQLLAYAGRGRAALEVLEAVPGDDRASRLPAAIATATALTQLGRASEALQLVDDCLRWFEPLGPRARLMTHQITAARARPLMVLGRLAEAEQSLRVGREGAREGGDRFAEAINATALGGLLPWQGRPAEALELARHAVDLLTASHHRAVAQWAWMSVGFAASVGHGADDVRAALRATAAVATETMTDGVRPLFAAGLAELEHDTDRARAVLLDGAAMCRRRELVFEEACALHGLALLGVDPGPRLDELAGLAGGLVDTFAAHARALVAADPDDLAAVAARFAGHGAHGLAADVLGRAAEAAARQGRMPLARRLAAAHHDQAAAADPGLVSPPVVVAEPLTAREKQVAELAARGHTSSAIAELLGLSARTVDNHLARVFEKLAVGGRAELGRALGMPGPTR